MGRRVFVTGNTYGSLNKGKPGKRKGIKHPSDCNHCRAVRTGNHSNASKQWMAAFHKRQRLRRFGLTQEQYDQMVADQHGLCAICRNPPGKPWFTLAIDHDHQTGKVRGLLCVTCNTRLGFLEARWATLLDYIERGKR